MSIEEDQHCGSGGLINDSFDRPEAKPGPAPEVLDLTRCAACYDQKKHSMPRRRGDSESSSEASDHESEWDSESSSSSSSSEGASRPGADHHHQEDTTPGPPEALGLVGQGRDLEGTGLPPAAPSRSRFQRPPSVVSTLQLQVLPSNQGDVTVYTQAGYRGQE